MHTSQRTHFEMLPQSRTLESPSADKPGQARNGAETRKHAGVQHGREGRRRKTTVTPARGAKGVQYVFVLDKRGNPLMPTHPSRARELLKKGRAVVVRRTPFVIRLKDRVGGEVQPVRLGVDPGSVATGMAVSRDDDGHRTVLFGLEVRHRSRAIHLKMLKRSKFRRRRRSTNVRYRSPRHLNRKSGSGWLAPSLRSRVHHIRSWASRLQRWVPISGVDLELVKFDIHRMVYPELGSARDQPGPLAGYELREYLLEKFDRRCVYCDARNVQLNIDHVWPRGSGGPDRLSNFVLACVSCNAKKGKMHVQEFAPHRAAQILRMAKTPLRDAAAVNSTRNATRRAIEDLDLNVSCWSGARTKMNRINCGVAKSHVADAACCGQPQSVRLASTLVAQATGRGNRQRTRPNAFGFPRSLSPRSKRLHGFQTGDLVKATIPSGPKRGVYVGRVNPRSTNKWRVAGVDGIHRKYVSLIQRADGYDYTRL